jgi:hypothetical protein
MNCNLHAICEDFGRDTGTNVKVMDRQIHYVNGDELIILKITSDSFPVGWVTRLAIDERMISLCRLGPELAIKSELLNRLRKTYKQLEEHYAAKRQRLTLCQIGYDLMT